MTRRYQVATDAAKEDPELEDQVDIALRELAQIEQRALSQPAPDVAALRFKIGLWANGRVEGYEAMWRVFSEDCERFLPR